MKNVFHGNQFYFRFFIHSLLFFLKLRFLVVGIFAADTLMNFAKQIHRKETVQSFLDYLERDALTARVEAEQGDQAAEILNRLTGEKRGRLRSRLSKAFYSRLPKYQLPVPIDADSLNEVLSYLFPDSDLAKELPRKFPSVAERKESVSEDFQVCKSIKQSI